MFFYSKINQTHNISNLFYFGTTLYMFRTVFPSIIRSLRLYIQHQVYVRQVLWLLRSHRTWRTPPTAHANQFQLFHDSSRQQYGVTVTRCCSYSCFVLLKMGDSDARNM